MKKALFILVTVLLLVVCACVSAPQTEQEGVPRPIYFLAPSGTAHGGDALRCSEEYLDLREGATTTEIAVAVVERLLKGSQNGALISPFPPETTLISLTIRNGRANVDLGGISLLEGIELTLADYCLTLSLAAIEGIDSVSITSNGRPMIQQPRRVFYPYDVILSSEDSDVQQVQVTLYFLNANGTLTGEKRTLDIYEGETQSAVLLAALFAGPKNSELSRVIPEGFAVSSVKTEDGICLLHLPPQAIQALPEDEYTQSLILWSLTESLYSLDYIHGIRLLVDGEELEYFGSVPVSGVTERPQG